MTLYFYQDDHLNTVLDATSSRTVFRSQNRSLAEQQRGGGQGGARLMATDLQGSVLQAQNEEYAWPSSYTAFGHRPLDDSAPVPGFAGERQDRLTGCYQLGNGYRAYNPTVFRFLSPDTLSPFDSGGLNAYTYCEGDPVNFTDPSGHVRNPLVARNQRPLTPARLPSTIEENRQERARTNAYARDARFAVREAQRLSRAHHDNARRHDAQGAHPTDPSITEMRGILAAHQRNLAAEQQGLAAIHGEHAMAHSRGLAALARTVETTPGNKENVIPSHSSAIPPSSPETSLPMVAQQIRTLGTADQADER